MADQRNSSPVETTETPVFAGESGDGGNRTHGLVHASPLDLIRGYALALRDLAEGIDALEANLTLAGGAVLTWTADDGFHLLTDGETLDISEWVDHVDLIPVEGVESVRDQFVTLAQKAGA